MTDSSNNPNPLALPAIDLVELAFANAYLENDCNASKAAIAVGVMPEMAIMVGADMRSRPSVRFLIGQMLADRGATLEKCVADLLNRCFTFDPADYEDYMTGETVRGADGNFRLVTLKDLRKRGFPTRYIKKMHAQYHKDGTVIRTLEFHDGLKALEMLLKALTDKSAASMRPLTVAPVDDRHPAARLLDVSDIPDLDENAAAEGEDAEPLTIPLPPGIPQPPGMGETEEEEGDEERPETVEEETA